MRLSVMSRVAGLGVLVTFASTVGLALASCSRENVHGVNLLIDGVDGAVLNGFDCVSDKGNQEVERCIFSTCNDQCRTSRAPLPCVDACTSNPDDGGVRKTCAAAGEGPPLLEQASGQQVCVVLDYLSVGGEIECRSMLNLLDWCLQPEHQMCPVIDRHTFPVRLPAMPAEAGPTETARALDATYAAIHDVVTSQPVLPSPSPDEWVIARLFASTQDCDSLAKSPNQIDITKIVGCATSCTVLLKDRTDVPLVLDNGVTACGSAVLQACAAMGTTALPGVRASFQRP
jgi:hypothetical protein